MKTVLSPIDFSDASINALWFAAELSKRASARLVVFSVIRKDKDEEESLSKLEDASTNLRRAFGDAVVIDVVSAEGDLISAMKDVIKNQQPDLIVMGTKGASGLKEILIGSNTVNVISKTTVPVLVIPEVARFEGFLNTGRNRVVLATDLDSVDNEGALDLLKEIALLLIEPKVTVVSVRPKDTELDYMKRLQRDALLGLFNPEIESERATVFSNNVMSGLNFYLDKNHDTGLVAMIARDTGHLIQRHYTHEMASHTHYPLLVLHDISA